MRNERHKRKETVSLILVSNIDNTSRHYTFSVLAFRASVGLAILLILGVLAVGIYSSGIILKTVNLEKQAEESNQRIRDLEVRNLELEEERETLQLEVEALAVAEAAEAEKEEEELEAVQIEESMASAFPKFYPSDGVGILKETFSEQHPFLTIIIPQGDNVVATGDGTVLAVDYHDSYLHSIEIEHEMGYVTRYFCDRNVDIKVKAGDQVKAREALFSVESDQTQLHYQIVLEGEALNPFSVMKLEG